MRVINNVALGLILTFILLSLLSIYNALIPVKSSTPEWLIWAICITCQLYAGTRSQKS